MSGSERDDLARLLIEAAKRFGLGYTRAGLYNSEALLLEQYQKPKVPFYALHDWLQERTNLVDHVGSFGDTLIVYPKKSKGWYDDWLRDVE